MQAALGLFIASFGVMILGFLLVVWDVAVHHDKFIALGKEMGLLYTVSLASPFVLVRFVYSALGDYSGNPRFSVIYGDNTTYLLMDVLMEICAVGICLVSALFVPAPKNLAKAKREKVRGADEAATRVDNRLVQRTDEIDERARRQREPSEIGSELDDMRDTEHNRAAVQDSEFV